MKLRFWSCVVWHLWDCKMNSSLWPRYKSGVKAIKNGDNFTFLKIRLYTKYKRWNCEICNHHCWNNQDPHLYFVCVSGGLFLLNDAQFVAKSRSSLCEQFYKEIKCQCISQRILIEKETSDGRCDSQLCSWIRGWLEHRDLSGQPETDGGDDCGLSATVGGQDEVQAGTCDRMEI